MKKDLFAFMILCCVSLIITSCDKEDSGGLVYTNWNGYNESGQRISLHFKDDNQCVKTYHYDKIKPLAINYKYKSNGNKIEILSLGGHDIVATGNIDGKTITMDIDDEIIVFIRD